MVIFRSSNEETSGSLVDRDRFQFRPHDATLEQTAGSQEKNQDDAVLKELSKQSPPRQARFHPSHFLQWSFRTRWTHKFVLQLACRVLTVSSP
jgi:hypothetical protein